MIDRLDIQQCLVDVRAVMTHGGHPGGSASTLRILRAFEAQFRPDDLLLSSKGHDAAAFMLFTKRYGAYRQVNGYPGHPERGVTPGAIVSTVSLGMGLSKAVGDAVHVMDVMGKDLILVETVGTGQQEVEIINHSHTVIVVLVPGMGDEIQAIKAGLLEVADLVVKVIAIELAGRKASRNN